MTEHPNAARIRALYEIGSTGDMGAIAHAFDENIEWNEPGRASHARTHRGKAEVMAFFSRVIPGLDSFSIELHDVLASDDHVVALVVYDHKRGNRRFHQLGTEVYHLNADGKITAFWALIDDTAAFDEFFA